MNVVRSVFARFVTRALGLLMAVAVFAAVLAAGRSYLVCRTTNAVIDSCCADEHKDTRPAADVASCCDVRTQAAPGDAVQPVATAILASTLAPSFGAPLAVIAPAPSSRVETQTHPDWTGPPIDEQRARLSIFLL